MRTTKPSRHANHFQATRRRVSQITVLTRAPRQTGNPKRCGAAGRNRLRDAKRAYRREIDESFRDDKSGGLDMAHTRSQHPERLERLLLAVALATLWCHELGEQVMSQAESIRRLIFQSPRPTCYSISLANLSNSSTSNIGVIQFVLGNTNRCPNIQHRTAITCALRNCLTKQKRPTAPVDQKDSRFA